MIAEFDLTMAEHWRRF